MLDIPALNSEYASETKRELAKNEVGIKSNLNSNALCAPSSLHARPPLVVFFFFVKHSTGLKLIIYLSRWLYYISSGRCRSENFTVHGARKARVSHVWPGLFVHVLLYYFVPVWLFVYSDNDTQCSRRAACGERYRSFQRHACGTGAGARANFIRSSR